MAAERACIVNGILNLAGPFFCLLDLHRNAAIFEINLMEFPRHLFVARPLVA